MIVVSTDFDSATRVLAGAADDLVSSLQSDHRVQKLTARTPATAAAIQLHLVESPDKPLVFYGHGCLKTMQLIGQDGRPAIEPQNQVLLADRTVCALSCHSTRILTGARETYSAKVIGFRDKLRVPIRERYARAFRSCLNAAPREIHAGGSVASAKDHSERAFRDSARNLRTGNISDRVMGILVFDWNATQIDALT